MARFFQFQNKVDPLVPLPGPATSLVASVLSVGVIFAYNFSYQVQTGPVQFAAAETVTVDKWFEPLSEPTRRKGLGAALQDVVADSPFNEDTTLYPKWGFSWSEPVRQRPGLRACLQDTVADVAFVENTTFESKWHEPLSEPVRVRKFGPQLQDVAADVPQPGEVVTEDKWYSPWSEPVRVRRLHAAYQQFSANIPFVEDTTLYPKWGFAWSEPVRLKSGLRAQLQDTVADVAFVEDTTLYPKWGFPWTDPVRPKKRVPPQDLAWSTFTPSAVTEDEWHQAWSDPVRLKRGLAAHQQQIYTSGYTPDPSAFLEGWYSPLSEPVRTRFLRTTQQQQPVWSGFTPSADVAPSAYFDTRVYFSKRVQYQVYANPAFTPTAEIVTLDKWYAPWREPSRIRVSVAYRQPEPWTPFLETVVSSEWYSPWTDPTRPKKLLAAQQQFFAWGYSTPAQVTDIGWMSPLGGPVRAKFTVSDSAFGFSSVDVSLVDMWLPVWPDRFPRFSYVSRYDVAGWSAFTPTAETIFEDKWHQPWSEPVRTRTLKTAVQQSLIWSGFTPATETIFEDKWHQAWSEPVRLRRLSTAQQQAEIWSGFTPTFTGTDVAPAAYFDTRVYFSKRIQYQVYANPAFAPFQEVIYEDKWHFPWSEPVRQKKGLAAHEQQFLAFNPQPFVSFSYYGWLTEPVRLKKGIPAYEQQALAFNPQPFVTFGYYGWLSEPVRLKKGLPAQLQTTEAGPPTFTALSRLIQWFEPLSEPVRLKKGLLARLQQFFGVDTKPIANVVTVVIAATETNNDTAEFYAVVYNAPARCWVSIEEIPRINNAYASIEET